MVPVFLSWVISPICSGICVTILYGLILRPFVLRAKNSFQRAYWVSFQSSCCISPVWHALLVLNEPTFLLQVLPFLVGLTFFIVVIFIIQTGESESA